MEDFCEWKILLKEELWRKLNHERKWREVARDITTESVFGPVYTAQFIYMNSSELHPDEW